MDPVQLSLIEGGIMVDMALVVANLRKERERAAREVQRLDAAIAALGKLEGRRRAGRTYRKRTLSAAARKRIAAAQKARWAKWKAEKSKKAA